MANETDFVKKLMLVASEIGARLFRNNVGMGWSPSGRGSNIYTVKRSQAIQCHAGDVIVKKARPLHAGLCKGSSDLIGWSPIKITEDMVGQTVAVFTAVEVKVKSGKATVEQANFINTVESHGGRAGIVRTNDDLIEVINRGIKND